MIESAIKPGTLRQDRAKLYSGAHKESVAGYRSFSASREQVLGQFRRLMATPATNRLPRPEVEQSGAAQPALTQQHAVPLSEPSAARWYALHSVFAATRGEAEPRIRSRLQPPVIAVFSLAGGVGKTCLVATLGRCLSGFREHVLLAEMAVCGMLPFYFGSRDVRPGVRMFSPPGPQPDAPVQVLNLVLNLQASRSNVDETDPVLGELSHAGRGLSRILVDIATGDLKVMRRLLRAQPTTLVPLIPDMSSVVGLELLEGVLANPAYLLNQFDAGSSLHADVRAMLQQRLGDRLLPFVVHHSSVVSEALAEGMTVLDYAPDSGPADDYRRLAAWLRNHAGSTVAGNGRARWSELSPPA
jgi:cellulose biosynthesis protein BcsQ